MAQRSRKRRTRRTSSLKRKRAIRRRYGFVALIGFGLVAAMHLTAPSASATPTAPGGTPAPTTTTAASAATAASTIATTQTTPTPETDPALSEVAVVQTSFNATGAEANSALIHDYSVLNHQYWSPQMMADFGGQLEQDFALQQAKIVTRNQGGERIWEVCGNVAGHTVVTVVLSSFQETQQQPAESLLTVSEQLPQADVTRLGSDMLAMEQVLKRFQVAPQISSCISGFTGARLGNVQPENLVGSAFQAVHARRVEGISSASVTSISGYTPMTPWKIETAGGSMNLQVGVQYDTVNHETHVVVGSPIIVTTY